LQKLGRHEEALQWFDRALALRAELENKMSSLRIIKKF
jgi:hypothetical protein